MGIGAIIVGLILFGLQALIFYFIITDIIRIHACSERVNGKVKSVTEEQEKHKDSKTGKTEYSYSYKVTFEYNYNGQTYESTRNYSNHCRYSRGDDAEIKINPRKPEETWTKDELKNLLGLSLSIPLFLFFDLIYIESFF